MHGLTIVSMHGPTEIAGPTSPLATGLKQRYLVVPKFRLENGVELSNVPIAFQTWGQLNPATKANVILVCHPISGNADVSEWWSPLFGAGNVLDPEKYLIVCCNAIGSPYGTLSPLTRKGGEEMSADGTWTCPPHVKDPNGQDTETWWGADLPPTTLRDDVRYVFETDPDFKRRCLIILVSSSCMWSWVDLWVVLRAWSGRCVFR